MKYQLTDYNGNSLQITQEQALKIADKAELIGINVGGQIHYVAKNHIAEIRPIRGEPDISRALKAPDLREQPLGKGYKRAKAIRETL